MVSIGLQLYSVREDMERDFLGTLQRVKDAGYDSVEFAGFGGFPAAQLKAECARIGLTPLSAHIGMGEFEKNLDDTVAYAAELGLKYAIIPWTPCETLEDCQAVNALLKKGAAAFGAKGIRVGFHNHEAEFKRFDGRYGLEIIMDGVDGIFEIDCAWAQYAGVDVVDYIATLDDRVGPIHAKDLNADYKTRAGHDINVAVGEGIIDFKKIIGHLRAAGTLERGIVVEQEAFTVPPFEALAASVRELRKLIG